MPCSVYYVLNNPPRGWQGGKGFVTADMIKCARCCCFVRVFCEG